MMVYVKVRGRSTHVPVYSHLIMSSFVLAAAFWLSCLPYIHAFYLPGAAPHNYIEGEKVDLFVNALTPMLSGARSAKIVCIFSFTFLEHISDAL
jgi:hypothetical protein